MRARPQPRSAAWPRVAAGMALAVAAGLLLRSRVRARPPALEPPAVTPPPAPISPERFPPPQIGTTLTQQVRARLAADPRTAGLGHLEIHVAYSTVYVRGRVPAGTDEPLREVIAAVPGVAEVNLPADLR